MKALPSIFLLLALPGIGPKIAREIIRNRPYHDAKELQARVKGIGPKTWENLKRYVRFR
ncbi:MAG: helix-hairpin-helix domain-containing protein [Meiothermus sp.]|nr:helix-hairpin-helix domain-containing protein [Meiothermus sp.]